jgi:hypothetical protein
MIEIIVLFKLCSRIGEIARAKGRGAIGYQLMLLLFWFGTEFSTLIISMVVLALVYGEHADDYTLIAYIAAIVGAALGALVALTIVKNLPELIPEKVHADDFEAHKPM